jgi:hypothetical protein
MGITITIAAASDIACPVKSLRHLFEKYSLPSYSLLFTLSRDPTSVDSAFTRPMVISRLRIILLDGDAYKGYIEVHPEHVYHVSRRLQTLPPPPEGH